MGSWLYAKNNMRNSSNYSNFSKEEKENTKTQMSRFDPYDHLNIKLNPDGKLNRGQARPRIEAKPNGDPVVSKDVTLNVKTKTWVRIFRPTKLPSNNDNTIARLPIVIYCHHGGWILLSAADSNAHTNCEEIASELLAIVVSVNYRLAPESRLPAQYEDAVDAINWVKEQATNPNGEQWLRDYGDFSRCYLYGVGCGGNIVLYSGLKTDLMELEPLKIAGIIMNQPMFGGLQRTESELRYATDEILPLPVLDLLWELALPKSTNQDHRYCNPMVQGPHKQMISTLKRCLVTGFSGDPMIDRQQQFVEMLVECGVQVEACFDDYGFHNIDLVDPRRANELLNIVREFMFR
ncbi:hypothetical protein RGQ29_028551 [Quercus rubra]|uniref:Alpha/beta hydrolase fold-3 domain-containing protein n=1 Tax=Quercus rubra TaxID=3512 RepID=A0AAN7IF48_QUERU|nr:hypothetical protein RGQ29_028551 [Quercus rubra]